MKIITLAVVCSGVALAQVVYNPFTKKLDFSGSGSGLAAAFDSLVTTSFSATPTYTAASATKVAAFKITLTGNVTSSTLSGSANGQYIAHEVCQDGTGGRSHAWPANYIGGMTISATRNSAASTCYRQLFFNDGTNVRAVSADGGNELTAGVSGGLQITGTNTIDYVSSIIPDKVNDQTLTNLWFFDPGRLDMATGDTCANPSSGRARLCVDGANANRFRVIDSTGADLLSGSPIFVSTSSATVANTVTETTLVGSGVGSATLAANSLIAGRGIRVRADGYIGTHSTAGTVRIRVKYGSTTVLDTGAQTMTNSLSNRRWSVDALIMTRTTGASGTVIGQGAFEYNTAATTAGAIDMVATATTTIDTTASQAISMTIEWGTANAANTITCTNFGIWYAGLASGTASSITTTQRQYFPTGGTTSATNPVGPGWMSDSSGSIVTLATTGTTPRINIFQFPDNDTGTTYIYLETVVPQGGGSTLGFEIYHANASTTASTTAEFDIGYVCIADNEEYFGPSFATLGSATITGSATLNRTLKGTLSATSLTGCSPGELIRLKIERDETASTGTTTYQVSGVTLNWAVTLP